MDLFDTTVLSSVQNFTEDASAGLLIFGEDLLPQKCIAKCGFSGVEISCDKYLARSILDSVSEGKKMFDALVNLPIQQRGD
jgi:hypothetical protein